MTGRRGLTVVLIACALASALVVYAASRVWGEVVTVRPAPFPPLVTRRTGSSLAPWLPALGVVGLAGAGALVATRGVARALVGGLLAACGAGTVLVALLPLGDRAGVGWPLLSAAAGLVVAAAGVFTIRNNRGWPALGARYERPATPSPRTPEDRDVDGPADDGGVPENGGGQGESGDRPLTEAQLWDAIDRGEDPTR
jgi:hypothetical protein